MAESFPDDFEKIENTEGYIEDSLDEEDEVEEDNEDDEEKYGGYIEDSLDEEDEVEEDNEDDVEDDLLGDFVDDSYDDDEDIEEIDEDEFKSMIEDENNDEEESEEIIEEDKEIFESTVAFSTKKSEKLKELFDNSLVSNDGEYSHKEFFLENHNKNNLLLKTNNEYNVTEVEEAYCPICGSRLEKYDKAELENFVEEYADKYFKMDKNSSFQYIDCETCTESIKSNGVNNFLLSLNEVICDSVGLKLDKKLTKKIYGNNYKIYPTSNFIAIENDGTKRIFSLSSLCEYIKKSFIKSAFHKPLVYNGEEIKEIYDNIKKLIDQNDKVVYNHNTAEYNFENLTMENDEKIVKLIIDFIESSHPIVKEVYDRFITENQINTIYDKTCFCSIKETEEGYDVDCKINRCKKCPKEWSMESYEELVNYAIEINVDETNESNCKLFNDYINTLESEKMEFQPLTDEEYKILKDNFPSDKILNEYKEQYKDQISEDNLEEYAIRKYIEDKKKELEIKKNNSIIEDEFISSDEEIEINMDSENLSSAKTRRAASHWEEVEEEEHIRKAEKERKERMEYGKVDGDDLLSDIEVDDEEEIDPALENKTLLESLKESVFYKMVRHIKADSKNKATFKFRLNKDTNYIPILDCSTGLRFVLVETDDPTLRTYLICPITLSSHIPFYFREHKYDFKTYVLYKCNVKNKFEQTVSAMVKLINYNNGYPKNRICRLGEDYVPVYTTEQDVADLFFKVHSPYSMDLFHVESLVIVGIIDENKFKNSVMRNKRNFYKEEIEKYTKYKYRTSAINDNLTAAVAGIRFYANKIKDSTGTRVVAYHYVITQYTEATGLMLENGLWYAVIALMKEHDMRHNENRMEGAPRVQIQISFDLDRTAPPSPILLDLIRQDGCLDDRNNWVGRDLEVADRSKGLAVESAEFAGLIPDPNMRQLDNIRDESIIDIRYLKDEKFIRRIFKEVSSDIPLKTIEDKEEFFMKKGFDLNFTVPEGMRFDVRAEALLTLYESDVMDKFKKVSIHNYSEEMLDKIVSDNAEDVQSILGPVWSKLAEDAPTDFLKNVMEKVGKNLDMKTLGSIINMFKGE